MEGGGLRMEGGGIRENHRFPAGLPSFATAES